MVEQLKAALVEAEAGRLESMVLCLELSGEFLCIKSGNVSISSAIGMTQMLSYSLLAQGSRSDVE